MFYLEKLIMNKHPLIENGLEILFNKHKNFLIGINGSGKTTILEIIISLFSLNPETLKINDSEINVIGKFVSYQNENESLEISYRIKSQNDLDKSLLIDKYDLNELQSEIITKIKYQSNKHDDFSLSITPREVLLLVSKNKFTFDRRPSLKITILMLLVRLNKVKKITDSANIFSVLGNFYNNTNINRFSEGLEYQDRFFKNKATIHISEESSFIVNNKCDSFLKSDPEKINDELDKIYSDYSNDNSYNENIILTSTDSVLLSKLSNYLGFNDIKLNYYVNDIKNIEDSETIEVELGSLKISVTLADGSVIPYEKLSYGEKRFFNIYNYLKYNSSYFLDEPVNGLHHSFIEILFEEICDNKKQFFIANQNPVLFDYIEIESSTDFESQIVFCRKNSNAKFNWSNPNENEIKLFMEDYDNNFLPVNMILKNLKLW